MQQLFRDARLGRIHPGNSLLTHEVVGKLSLGINPDEAAPLGLNLRAERPAENRSGAPPRNIRRARCSGPFPLSSAFEDEDEHAVGARRRTGSSSAPRPCGRHGAGGGVERDELGERSTPRTRRSRASPSGVSVHTE